MKRAGGIYRSPFFKTKSMKIYISRSSKLVVVVNVGGLKVDIPFIFGIPAETMKCAYVKDVKIQEALEKCPDFGSEFWLMEEVKDKTIQEELPADEVVPDAEIPEVVSEEQAGDNPEPKEELPVEKTIPFADFPEVTNGQSAKKVLAKEVKGETYATVGQLKVDQLRKLAKDNNISFSNWK